MKLKISHEVKKTILRYGISIILTLLFGGILIAIQGESPLEAVGHIFEGAFGNRINIGNTIRWVISSLMVGGAATVAFKSGVSNLGIEGQLYMGALSAAIIGYSLELPQGLHIIVCLLAASILGMLYALIPALLRMYFKINELVTTLILNFIAKYLTEYITMWVIMGGQQSANGSASITTPQILNTARLSTIIKGTTANTGIFIALGILFFIAFIYKYTLEGYEFTQIGQNMNFARMGGVNINKSFIMVFLMSGLISGMGGGIEVTGSYYRFMPNFSNNLGWDGIMITRVANNNPIAVIIVSIIWGALKQGSLHMERMTTLNRLVVIIIQMLFVLFVSIDYDNLFSKWKEKIKLKKTNYKGGSSIC
ncbi:ABC transporter permease [Tissierella sp. MB52-C2]|uniref:ABC transporter permease n=1 Tax=Tissierella sp. MB52-C2 TaxID=3070999 RepID=UPI00280BE250|nr:ABC transporter permease [Tissierella sp. MB52-C2]WMM24438.1 ABC transporter permease [Tissierella sp. MB52-C2]